MEERARRKMPDEQAVGGFWGSDEGVSESRARAGGEERTNARLASGVRYESTKLSRKPDTHGVEAQGAGRGQEHRDWTHKQGWNRTKIRLTGGDV
jgi:hypothetical protein